MPKLGGVKEAAAMLAGLDSQGRERVLDLIAKENPEVAEALRKNMVSFEDLQFLTVKMLSEQVIELYNL